ncbi:unnamed protein product [Chironomus riparius]|uniref:Uncharacterized protein n=1 Tax=Chironomus riparius TaxID=315576 RepID=A0A9P0NKS5_9DIPT|nr:unnamed protein product [Chironomus riparius]
MKLKCEQLSVLVTACILCLQITFAQQQKYHPRPLVFKSWPPMRSNSAQMMLQLRGAGSTNIIAKQPPPHMFIKSNNPVQFAMQMPARFANRPLKSSPSSHVFFKTGSPSNAALKKPYISAMTPSPVFKFSSPAQKTAIKFKSPPPVPLKSKPEFIYEKVTLPKYAEPVIGTEAAIHQIAAPNLSLNQLDSDLTKVSVQAFALENQPQFHQPIHQYKVHETSNDVVYKNAYTGQKTLYAPDHDNIFRGHPVPITEDPRNIPSDNKPKPADVLYHTNIEFNASPLVQQHFAVDPFGFPVTAQPQLQQYHLQQNAMLQQGMPLASYNPTYLVMQSNNLLGQHQQHFQHQNLFSPAQGYVDTSGITQPSYATPPYSQNHEVASLGQIYSAQRDHYHQLEGAITSTVAPSTISNYYQDYSASQNVPAVSHLEPNPVLSNYQHSPNFLDFPDDHLSSNDIQNFLNYDDDAYQRQLENDVILKEAHERLNDKLQLKKHQEATINDLHVLATAEKFNPLRIIVPDNEHQEVKNKTQKYSNLQH